MLARHYLNILTDTYPCSSMTLAHSLTLSADCTRPPHFASVSANPYGNFSTSHGPTPILQGIGSPSTWLSDGEKLFVPSFGPRAHTNPPLYTGRRHRVISHPPGVAKLIVFIASQARPRVGPSVGREERSTIKAAWPGGEGRSVGRAETTRVVAHSSLVPRCARGRGRSVGFA